MVSLFMLAERGKASESGSFQKIHAENLFSRFRAVDHIERVSMKAALDLESHEACSRLTEQAT